MTCEIAIMNLNAVALAADSAMTVRQWVNGEQQTRFFKGSNKIFQLSNSEPVGLMIFGSANLQGIPWELIVKEFRAHLKATSYPRLDGYAEALFDYIRQHPHFFSESMRARNFVREVDKIGYILAARMAKRLSLKDPPSDGDEASRKPSTFLDEAIALQLKTALPKAFGANLDSIAFQKHGDVAAKEIEETLHWPRVNGRIHPDWVINIERLTELAIRTLYREYANYMGDTGVVIAGFGAQDLFPSLRSYRCFGLLLDSFLADEDKKMEISVDQPSLIQPFATTSMVETFLVGFSQDVYDTVTEQFEKSATELVDKVKAAAGIQVIVDEEKILKDIADEYGNAWASDVGTKHFRPLQEVVASLPIDEMASLAETLISLQSLKEKVTAPTESVGGPVDVAVISRSDGLIWIKRKHYFDPAKNSRFFSRQQNRQ